MNSSPSYPWAYLTKDPHKTFQASASVNGGYDEGLNKLSSSLTRFTPFKRFLQLPPAISTHPPPLSPLVTLSVWQSPSPAMGPEETAAPLLETWPHIQPFYEPDASLKPTLYSHHATPLWSPQHVDRWPQPPSKHVQFAADFEQIIHTRGLRDERDPVVPACCRPRALATIEPTRQGRDARDIQNLVSHKPTQRDVETGDRSTVISHRGITLTLTAKIAEGGVRCVVAAGYDGQSYAVKAIHKWRAFKTLYYTRAMFVQERDAMVRVSASGRTQYLAQLLMAWEEREIMYLVMPRYPANMRAVLDEEHILLKDRLLYCVELIAAVQALWRLGIVHQDIKPQNVLIDHNGCAVLSDFGIAEMVGEGGYNTWRDYNECGTPAYMAPEIVARDHAWRGHGAEVDVWSLGIVFLEILGLTDRWYFLVPNCETARKLHERALPIRLDIPPNAGEIPTELLPRMLKTDPAERIPVSELHAHVPPRMWDEVVTGTQSHKWRPDSTCVPQKLSGRCLDFATFRENERRLERFTPPTDADADMRRQFREEQSQAKISDFEYLAPGAFTCSDF
ncbi:Serine/threonine-protein kinase MRCK gamma [Trametes pubescens]|uniref:Serine/threonine-protein kinase MRCK gamma n=1 Tax=Trametes pubescens TaxID=154538 RepID=A0A1M2VLY5_TRAPU|nr:Serine/threonine-protein kinase MRCK gamma [Trametes pubescens]